VGASAPPLVIAVLRALELNCTRISQAWIEASTKGAVLMFTASEIETRTIDLGVSPAVAGLLGGMGGGITQAYATMGMCSHLEHDCLAVSGQACFRLAGILMLRYDRTGFCTCMKTAEITRHKQAASGVQPPSTWAVFADIYRRGGIAGINKGVNAVALRQMTNWGSR
jgi:hypothetical protein